MNGYQDVVKYLMENLGVSNESQAVVTAIFMGTAILCKVLIVATLVISACVRKYGKK